MGQRSRDRNLKCKISAKPSFEIVYLKIIISVSESIKHNFTEERIFKFQNPVLTFYILSSFRLKDIIQDGQGELCVEESFIVAGGGVRFIKYPRYCDKGTYWEGILINIISKDLP